LVGLYSRSISQPIVPVTPALGPFCFLAWSRQRGTMPAAEWPLSPAPCSIPCKDIVCGPALLPLTNWRMLKG
jgi:hypothetical protein